MKAGYNVQLNAHYEQATLARHRPGAAPSPRRGCDFGYLTGEILIS